MPPRQRLAVHFVSDERGWLHRLREPKRLVIAVGRAKENRSDVRLRLYLREQCRQRDAFPNGVRAKATAYSVGNTKQRRFLLDRRHRGNVGKRINTRVFNLPDNVQTPGIPRDVGINEVFRDLVKFVVWTNRRDFLHLRSAILAPVVTECTHLKKPSQSAAKSECDSRANSKRDETTATDGPRHRCRIFIYNRSMRRPA